MSLRIQQTRFFFSILFIWLVTDLSLAQNFTVGSNGVTILCPNAAVGDTATVNGVLYTKRDYTGLFNLVSSDPNHPELATSCVSDVTYLSGLFQDKSSFNRDISTWDVSSVTNTSVMFNNATSFNQDISKWDVSSVTDLSYMFDGAIIFNQDISSWDVSSVTNFNGVFVRATAFSVDVSSWDISSATTLSAMFASSSFNSDISGWDVSNITDLSYMFQGNTSFNQDISGWDVSSVTDFTSMFMGATSFDQDLGDWNVSSATSLSTMFSNMNYNYDLSGWDVNGVQFMDNMFLYNQTFNQDLSAWDVSTVTTMDFMFYGATAFNQDISGWDLSALTSSVDMVSYSGIDLTNSTTILEEWWQDGYNNVDWGRDYINNGVIDAGQLEARGWRISADAITPVRQITLVSPEDGAVNVNNQTTLSWIADSNATSYTVQVSTDGFSTFILDQVELGEMVTTPVLEYETTYSWRVRGTNRAGDSPWSETRTFTTRQEPLAATTLIAPENGLGNVGTAATFLWTQVTDAEAYEIQISKIEDFSDTEPVSGLTDTTYSTTLEQNQVYYWRVRAYTEQEESPWSEEFALATGVRTSIEDDQVPTRFTLEQNYPNPFNPTTIIRFTLPAASEVRLEVFSLLGQPVAVLREGRFNAGTYSVEFDGSGISSGVYLYRLTTPEFTQTRVMNLLK